MEGREKMEREERPYRAHILVLPYPIQGHINPMLQFSKRLSSKGIKVTLAITIHVAKSMEAETDPIRLETISDGREEGGFEKTNSGFEDYFKRFKIVGSRTLAQLIDKLRNSSDPVSCIVYDSFLPWALDVGKQMGLVAASFFTQSCAVSNIYYHVQQGVLTIPVEGTVVLIPGLPPLEIPALPSFVSVPGYLPSLLSLLLNQFQNLNKADWVLFNTFDQLEHEVLNWMAKLWRIRTIGPTMPSMYLDKRVEADKDYGLNLFEANRDTCIDWLNTKETASVVYASFGSIAALSAEKMEELAWGLRGSNHYFLWVVRASEKEKLPSEFPQETSEKELIVTWCPQLEVLSHRAIGCFVTHCGWNSTLEALSLGIPMVTLPQWTDQPTNAKCVEEVWKVGVRVRVDEQGISRRKEIETCIRDVMDEEKGKVFKKNASTWKELAKEAVDEGGSSDNNIDEFVSKLIYN